MSLKDSCVSAWEAVPVEIEAGASFSSPVNLGGLRFLGVFMPTDWTSAELSFQTSPDGTHWYNVFDQNGNEVLFSVGAGLYAAVTAATVFAPMQFLRIKSGSSAVPIVQAAARTLNLMLRSL